MKILKTLVLFVLVISLTPTALFAQTTDESSLQTENEVAVVEDVEGLRAEFKEYTQNPESKVVKYEMVINSNIDSDRIKVTWSLRGFSTFVDKTQAVKNISVQKGKSYSLAIELLPSGKGVTELVGKAEAFTVDGSFVATVRKNFATNSDQEVLPLTDSYKSAKNISTIKNLVITSLILVAIIALAFFGYKRFRVWLERP